LLSNPGIILRVKSYFLAFSRRQPAHEGSWILVECLVF
jgi:hypothetical protein